MSKMKYNLYLANEDLTNRTQPNVVASNRLEKNIIELLNYYAHIHQSKDIN